jgi:hypothetical protein
VIPDTLDYATQGELERYENNYKTLNLITTALCRNVYDRVAHLEAAHDVWLKLCNTYDCFARFESIAVLLLILIMNILNNCCMHLMILYGA